MKQRNVRMLCECALMLALAVALSYVKIISLPFAFGGSVTLLSMLPICLVSIKYGVAQGLSVAFLYAWFQILQGEVFAWGLTPGMLIGSLLLDYLVAFTVLGLAGILRRRGTVGILVGVTVVCVLRFISHFLAGGILWANFEEFIAFGQEWFNRPWLYSLCYNGIYMLPETVFTVLGAFFVLRTPALARFIQAKRNRSQRSA